MKRLAAIAIAILLGTGVATANGTTPRAPWSGPYIGLHGGWATGSWDGDLVYDAGLGPVPGIFDPASRSISASGWLAGGQIGFNHQVGVFVWGIEVDGAWTSLEGDETFTTVDFANDGKKDYTWGIKTRLDALGTVRARAGFAAGSVLFYGTGGLAFGRTTGDLTVKGHEGQGFPVGGQVTALGSATENHIGWTGGGGIEWSFVERWSIKFEYLYVDLGSANYRMTGTAYPGTPQAFPHTTDSFPADLTLHVVRGGANFKF